MHTALVWVGRTATREQGAGSRERGCDGVHNVVQVAMGTRGGCQEVSAMQCQGTGTDKAQAQLQSCLIPAA